MSPAPRSAAPRLDRMTRSNRSVHLDRHASTHKLLASIFRVGEWCGTILTLMLISDAILPLFLHSGPNNLVSTPATPVERLSYWLAYAFTLSRFLVYPRQIYRAAIRNPFVLGVVVIAALSILWSVDPATSIRRTFAFGMWTLFGYYLAARYRTVELLHLLAIALGLLAVMSLASAIAVPDYGREVGFDNGAWRGVFTTKNTLGEMMLLAAVVFGILAKGGGRLRWPAICGLLLAVPLIYFAKATAALLIVFVLLFTIPVVLTFRKNNAAAALLLCLMLAVSAAASVVIMEQDAVLSVLGKDATLTGRTVLWAAVVPRIEERPVLGYGYDAFWVSTGVESQRVRTAVGWDTPHSHNGLLDTWLDLGLIGVLSLLAAYILALRRSWIALRSTGGVDGVWAMAFLVMLFLGNTTESSVSQSFLIWTVFVTVASMQFAPPRRA